MLAVLKRNSSGGYTLTDESATLEQILSSGVTPDVDGYLMSEDKSVWYMPTTVEDRISITTGSCSTKKTSDQKYAKTMNSFIKQTGMPDRTGS